jgi:hypothetical protein
VQGNTDEDREVEMSTVTQQFGTMLSEAKGHCRDSVVTMAARYAS